MLVPTFLCFVLLLAVEAAPPSNLRPFGKQSLLLYPTVSISPRASPSQSPEEIVLQKMMATIVAERRAARKHRIPPPKLWKSTSSMIYKLRQMKEAGML